MSKQRVNMDLDKELWKQVGITAIELGIQKREVVEKSLKEFIEKNDNKKEESR
ncbi:hypothetical protein [Sporosarcina jiandibaonis]|uniref:hypothetical protein n=1 Tax=Sporosarcina jiandibaonis TaxID=2715535 RepID=UPI0015536524|nr:hypothetical protein [Sporosarcina jiandibaonis]